MILEIPFTPERQIFNIRLGQRGVRLAIMFNERDGTWLLDVIDNATAVDLLRGVPIVLGQDIWDSYNLGLGILIALDLSNSGIDAGPNDLGDRVRVYWLTPDELEAEVIDE